MDFVRAEKRRGKGVVGIYCEFTPRDLILAAGAYPICLCGSSRKTIPPAETVLPTNLCPLIKSSLGYILTNGCPFFSMADLIVAETTCDGKKKVWELIRDRKPQHILELTQKVQEAEAWEHWLKEVGKLKVRLEELYKKPIIDDDLRSAISTMNRERALLRTVMEYGAEPRPVISGVELGRLRFRVSGMPEHHRMLVELRDALEERKRKGVFSAAENAPRVLVTGCPMSEGTLKIVEIIEEAGGIVVVQETCSGIKPLDPVSGEGDPLTAIAEKHFRIPCSCMTPNTGRLELLSKLAKQYSADAVVDLVWQACHTYNVESFQVGEFVRKELNLPYLKVETDYSPGDREQIMVRIQTLMEMAR
jgi:benzoyl-CoA reductase/2-hydroxyglutaryl-CoA dehydratase subunit BcrC/BadD/HgdB